MQSSRDFQQGGQKRRDYIAEALNAAATGTDVIDKIASARETLSPTIAPVAPAGGTADGTSAPGQPGHWTGDPNLDYIIDHESDGLTSAKNKTSSASGIGQLIKSNREAYGRQLGIDPNTTKYEEQLAMTKAYIKDRYGTSEKARKFWQQHGWY